MYFRVLGPLDVQVNGSSLRLDSARQRTVLAALLASANDLVPLECLIDWCWPRRPPRSAIATIQAHICRLRRALEPDRPAWAPPGVLLRRAPGYLIRIGADELDMLRFERLIAAGRGALERDDPRRAADLLGQALALWRGAPLPDLVHAEAAQPMIARLEALRLSALTTRIDADLRLGRELALIPELSALVRRHPYDERLCGQLMLALYRCGRQAESLEAYERMRLTLADDLAIAPSPASRRLQEAILAQHPDLDRVGMDRVGLDRPATGMVHEGVVHVVVPAE
ncbi:MAG TPA: AfsR/SARP family transcriptional regulator [Pilimelia sp.]|nr:AfsR/SARP family transcriptional regulator [Pilimelia sp.]